MFCKDNNPVTASTGGLLGLFLGFSFLSAVEALYFLTLRLWCSAHRAPREPAIPLPRSNIVRPFPFVN